MSASRSARFIWDDKTRHGCPDDHLRTRPPNLTDYVRDWRRSSLRILLTFASGGSDRAAIVQSAVKSIQLKSERGGGNRRAD